MKMRNKGKVHPSPSSSSSSSSLTSQAASSNRDALSILKLLPAAILALASVLCLQDREVLAYMVTRSLKTTTTTTTTPSASFSKRNSKKLIPHEPPIFDCDCFDCYRSYWFRWDSSPNRELIHQAIEAFEEHLSNGEQSKKTTRNKKKEKTTRRNGIVKPTLHSPPLPPPQVVVETVLPEVVENSFVHVFPEVEVSISVPVPVLVQVSAQESTDLSSESGGESEVEELAAVKDVSAAAELPEAAVLVARGSATNSHKGLARKVLPDVLGLFNSRLWSLWSPNM